MRLARSSRSPARLLSLAATAVALGLLGFPAHGAPAIAARFSRVVQDKPVGDFLRDLFAASSVKVDVSPGVTGKISGAFDGDVQAVFRKVSGAFNLQTYFDGRELYIYPPSEASTRYFGVDPADSRRIRTVVLGEGLSNRDNRVELRGGRLAATGCKRFLDEVAAVSARAATRALTLAEPPIAELPAASPPAPQEYRIYYLRYAWAADTQVSTGGQALTIPGVVTILRALIDDTDDETEIGAPTVTQSNPPAIPLRGLAAEAENRAGPTAPAGLVQLSPADRGRPADQPAAIAPRPAAADAVRVAADRRLNAIIIRDSKDRLDTYGKLIRALDVEPQLVEIEATIIDVDLDRLKHSGFAFGFEDARGDALISSPGGAASNPSGQGLYLSTVIDNNTKFVASLNALASQGVTRIVSHPLVLTVSDVQAVFQNSQTFYVPVNGANNADLFDVSAGTTLRVTPHVTRDKGENRIQLSLEIEDGVLTHRSVGSIPVVQHANLTTEALILDGQSLLVGGMVSQEDDSGRTKIPTLGDVPLVGKLFRTGDGTADHIERLFLITPHLTSAGGHVPEPPGVSEPLGQTDRGAAPVAALGSARPGGAS